MVEASKSFVGFAGSPLQLLLYLQCGWLGGSNAFCFSLSSLVRLGGNSFIIAGSFLSTIKISLH